MGSFLDESLERIDRAIAMSSLGERTRPPAQKKRIYYLLLAERPEEALETANQIIAEAATEAGGDARFVGTCCSFGYRERARVWQAMKRFDDAFLDCIRATWYWHDAMRHQDRTNDEHTPERAAEALLGDAAKYNIPVNDPDDFKRKVINGLKDSDPQKMASWFGFHPDYWAQGGSQ